MDVVKVLNIGDMIEVLHGDHQGKRGFVLEVQRWFVVFLESKAIPNHEEEYLPKKIYVSVTVSLENFDG